MPSVCSMVLHRFMAHRAIASPAQALFDISIYRYTSSAPMNTPTSTIKDPAMKATRYIK